MSNNTFYYSQNFIVQTYLKASEESKFGNLVFIRKKSSMRKKTGKPSMKKGTQFDLERRLEYED